jgi:hypothetical protein
MRLLGVTPPKGGCSQRSYQRLNHDVAEHSLLMPPTLSRVAVNLGTLTCGEFRVSRPSRKSLMIDRSL